MEHAENIEFLNSCLDDQGFNPKVRERVEFLVMDALDSDMSDEDMLGYKKIITRIKSL